MESWVLEGDSYSFLRSAPVNFNLRHRDRPDRVEIFDITAIPSPRSVISETTCLCDIFGDDCESPLSSSPPSFPKNDVDEHLVAEDVNDSSGSYHTANGSEQLSDASDTFEESKETSNQQTEDSQFTETKDSSSSSSHSTFSNEKTTAIASFTTNKVNESDSTQTENQQESHSQELLQTPDENKDSSSQQQVTPESEFRDANIRVTDPSQDTITPDLLSINRNISEESDSTSCQVREISSQPQQQANVSEESDSTSSQLREISSQPQQQENISESDSTSTQLSEISRQPQQQDNISNEGDSTSTQLKEISSQPQQQENILEETGPVASQLREIRRQPQQQENISESDSTSTQLSEISRQPQQQDNISNEGDSTSTQLKEISRQPQQQDNISDEGDSTSSQLSEISSQQQENILEETGPVASQLREIRRQPQQQENISEETGPVASQLKEIRSQPQQQENISEETGPVTSQLKEIRSQPQQQENISEETGPVASQLKEIRRQPQQQENISEETGPVASQLKEIRSQPQQQENISEETGPVTSQLRGIRSQPQPQENISEESDTAPSQLREISSQTQQQESPLSEIHNYSLEVEPLEKSPLEGAKLPVSSEENENNVENYCKESEEKISLPDVNRNCSSPAEDISFIQETVNRDLTNFSGDSDLFPAESCLLTSNSSVRALTPEISSSPAHMDIPSITSTEPVRLLPTSLDNDKEVLPNLNTSPITPSTSDAENNIEKHSPFLPHTLTISPEPREEERSSSRLSSSDIAGHATPEVSELCSFSDSSMTGHSSEKSVIIIYSPVGYTISPSPEFERKMYSPEPEVALTASEIPEMDYGARPTDSRSSAQSPDSKCCLTPDSRSISSTPESRQNFLTPEFMPTPSPDLRSATCSPEIQTIMCKSPEINGITYRVVSPQNAVPKFSPDIDESRDDESSVKLPSDVMTNPATSPTSNLSSTPGCPSRPPSANLSISRDTVSSPEIRDQRSPDRLSMHIPVQEPSILLNQEEQNFSTTVSDKLDLPSAPADREQLEDADHKESFKSCSSAMKESEDADTSLTSQIQVVNDSSSVPCSAKSSVIQTEDKGERTNASLSNLISCEKSESLSPGHKYKTMSTAPMDKQRSVMEGDDSCSGKEMLQREIAGSEKPHDQMPVRARESPTVFHSNNKRVFDRQPCMDKEWNGERAMWEEHRSGKGAGNIAEDSYRGEQVELSFCTRNRKGPTSHSPAPSSRDPKSGIPACCYFESPLTTRQQQNLLRVHGVQKENKSGARRIQCSAGRLPSECTSETSSMGSEFDETDNEVKLLTDLGFRSLSSPRVDYLDVYNSSHRSSTNISQPSTVESPGAMTWMSYADLRGSALHENNDVLTHPCSFLPHGNLDPAKHFEMGSFECVDVALDNKEDSKRGKRTVPKRQIQLKRRNVDESKSIENAGNIMDSPSMQRRSQDSFVRQHSTPAAGQEDRFLDESDIQPDKKMLQKSASLDESSNKTKMASSIIKSVLSKKMDPVTKESSRSDSSSPTEEKKKHAETSSEVPSSEALCNMEGHSLCSSLPSECSLSSEDFAARVERSPHLQKRSGPKVPPKPFFKPSFLPAFSYPVVGPLQDKNTLMDQLKPRLGGPFESKVPKKQIIMSSSEAEISKIEVRYNSDSANATTRSTSPAVTQAANAQNKMANIDMEQPEKQETHKQRGGRRVFLSKPPEITTKSHIVKDKKKSSLEVSLSPDLEISRDPKCEPCLEETPEEQRPSKTVEVENEDDKEKHKPKPVMHKVRDVRKLVKNTYNLSFKASNTTLPVKNPVTDEHKDVPPQNPHALHIECKAISWKDKQASNNNADKSELLKMNSEINSEITSKSFLPMIVMESQQKTTNLQVTAKSIFHNCNSTLKSSEHGEQSAKLEMPPRPKSKETSTVVFLQDGSSKSIQKPTSPALPEVKPLNSSHSVSMLLKEKGMQADIGVCDVLNNGARTTPKHINRLEVPLQTCTSEASPNESQNLKNEEASLNSKLKSSSDIAQQSSTGTSLMRSSPKPSEQRMSPVGAMTDSQSQVSFKEQEEQMSSHAPSVAQISTPLASSKAEVRSFSSSTKSHAAPMTTSKEIELPIQVRSVSCDRPKPFLPTKHSYKQPFAEIRSISSDLPKTDMAPASSISKQQTNVNSDVKKQETAATLVHKEQSSDVSSNSKKLAVSAVSSCKPSTMPVTTMSSSVQKSTTTSVSTGSHQVTSTTSLQNSGNRKQNQQNLTVGQEQVTPASSSHPVLPAVPQNHTYTQPTMTAPLHNQLHADDFLFHASDDPPSYEERESFSPLLLSDLPPRRLNRYHPVNKLSSCSCTTSSNPASHPYHCSENESPPASQSPGHIQSYPGAPPQAQVRPHQCRPEGQPLNYQSPSPKATIPQAPAMIQPLHHSHAFCAPVMQTYGDELKPSSSVQHPDRHSSNHHSVQAAGAAGYRDHGHSPNRAAMDPRSQFFNPQDLPPAFGHDYGSDGPGGGGMLYSDGGSGLGFGQGPRRVLLDPETGKYFYIEVPMQPLRKMLFDPEMGQYVEVLIPQQAMSHSGIYPPTAAPYPSLHSAGLYAPQYLPYAVPPHAQSAQQPRHTEPSVPTSLHQSPMGYGSSANQAPKSEAKGHPSLDQGYLEGMYYIPTRMNASPNSVTSERYRKPTSNMAATAGRRA